MIYGYNLVNILCAICPYHCMENMVNFPRNKKIPQLKTKGRQMFAVPPKFLCHIIYKGTLCGYNGSCRHLLLYFSKMQLLWESQYISELKRVFSRRPSLSERKYIPHTQSSLLDFFHSNRIRHSCQVKTIVFCEKTCYYQ